MLQLSAPRVLRALAAISAASAPMIALALSSLHHLHTRSISCSTPHTFVCRDVAVGMWGCACDEPFRFKRLVRAVFPSDPEGDGKRDATAKLVAYVSHNQDDVPRVCRKVRKIMDQSMRRGHIKRVSVGASLLRDLLLSASMMEYYVTFIIDAAETLLRCDEPEYRISGAELLNAIGFQLVKLAHDSTSRRLLADRCGPALALVVNMAGEGVGTQRVDALHCRYSALVCLGNVAAALGPLLADRAELMMQIALRALLESATEAERRAGASVNAPGLARRKVKWQLAMDHVRWATTQVERDMHYSLSSVVLPVDPDAKETQYRRACVRALASTVLCATSASLPPFVSAAFICVTSYNGWNVPTFAVAMSRVLAISLQEHHGSSGILAAQYITQNLESENVRATGQVATMLHCLRNIVQCVPMTGSRPVTLFTAVLRYVTAPRVVTSDEVADAAASVILWITKRAHDQRNIPTVVRLLAALSKHVVNALSASPTAQPALNGIPTAPSTPTSSSATASTLERVGTVVSLLSELAGIAGNLTAPDRQEIGLASAMLAVLNHPSTGSDGSICLDALTALRRYVAARPLVAAGPEPTAESTKPSGPMGGGGLLPSEAEALLPWLGKSYTSFGTIAQPSRLVAIADLIVTLYEAECVTIMWIIDFIFAAQEKILTPDTDAHLGPMIVTTLSAAILRAVAQSLEAVEMAAYADYVAHRNIPRGILSFVPHRRSTQAAADSVPKDSDGVMSDDGLFSSVSSSAEQGAGACEEAPTAVIPSDTPGGCGVRSIGDTDYVVPDVHEILDKVATPLTRSTVALYVSRQRQSIPRLGRELAAYEDDETVLKRLMGEPVSPLLLSRTESAAFARQKDDDVTLNITFDPVSRRLDPTAVALGSEQIAAVWALKLPSFIKALESASLPYPPLASQDPETTSRDEMGDQVTADADEAAYAAWLGKATITSLNPHEAG